MPCSTAQRPTASVSSRDATAPVGLDGEHHSSTLVRSVRAASSCSTVGRKSASGPHGDDDGHTAGERDRLGVGRPVRRGQQHLVARVEQRGEGLVDGLLAAVGDEHLRRGDLEAGVAQRLRGDRLAQLREARGGRVAVVARIGAGGLGGRDHGGRGGEVRLARAEADDRAARRLERLRLRVDGQRGGLGDPADPGGDAGAGGRCGGRGHDWILPHRSGPRSCRVGRGVCDFNRICGVPYTRSAGCVARVTHPFAPERQARGEAGLGV